MRFLELNIASSAPKQPHVVAPWSEGERRGVAAWSDPNELAVDRVAVVDALEAATGIASDGSVQWL